MAEFLSFDHILVSLQYVVLEIHDDLYYIYIFYHEKFSDTSLKETFLLDVLASLL